MAVPAGEELTGTRYLTLIVRLLLDREGAVLRGELTDAEGGTLQRFAGERGLYEAIGSYLAANIRRPGGGEPPL